MESFTSVLGPAFVERAEREGTTIVVGSGSVAASNLGGLVHELGAVRNGPVVVILTRSAERFVTSASIRHIGGCPVLTEQSMARFLEPVHVWLTEFARHVLVYPASAGFLGRIAHGIADDLASTTLVCATGVPTLVVPSMHSRMWSNPRVQRNVQLLRSTGIHVMDVPDGLAPSVADVVSASALMSVPNAIPMERSMA